MQCQFPFSSKRLTQPWCTLVGLGGEADKPAGEMRQKSPESAAQPMLVDGIVLEEDTEVTAMDIERAQEIAAADQQQQQQ